MAAVHQFAAASNEVADFGAHLAVAVPFRRDRALPENRDGNVAFAGSGEVAVKRLQGLHGDDGLCCATVANQVAARPGDHSQHLVRLAEASASPVIRRNGEGERHAGAECVGNMEMPESAALAERQRKAAAIMSKGLAAGNKPRIEGRCGGVRLVVWDNRQCRVWVRLPVR